MMSPRNLVNLGLLVAVMVLLLIVVLEPGKTPAPASPRLTTLQQDEINHILIQRDNGKDIELQKVTGRWQMLKPYPLPANEFRMQSILRLVDSESLSQNDLTGLDKKPFGLDKPRATITFNKQLTIKFGGNEPLQQHRYVATNNTLHLVNDSFYYQLAARETTFIDHRLLAGKQNIVKLVLPQRVIELKDGQWHAMPKNENISADAVTDLLNQWRNAQALELQASENSSSQQTATIYFKDQPQPVIFYIQHNKQRNMLIRKDLGLGYVVSDDNLEKLLDLSAAHKDNPAANDRHL